jgi:hypothetical protein
LNWDNATDTVKIGDDITSNKNWNQEYILALTVPGLIIRGYASYSGETGISIHGVFRNFESVT